MIHKIVVIDQRTTVGQVLYDDGIVILETDLLTGFISALTAFAKCIGEKSIEFKGADLGDNRFSLITRDHLTYAIFQDLFDNEPFARLTLKEIIDIYHDELGKLNLSMDTVKSSIKREIKNLIETEYFPISALKGINNKIEEIISNALINFDLMFLSSITNGIIQVWRRPINPTIMKQFLDIISKIPLEMNWLAEGKTSSHGYIDELNDDETEMEVWMIKRVSETNFFIAGRAIGANTVMQDDCSSKITTIFEEIASLIEEALQVEWIKMTQN